MSEIFTVKNVPGTMTIRHVAYRDAKAKAKAYFSSGSLNTPLGEFDVRMANKGLDQFEEGVYQGKFTIQKIFMDSRPWKDRVYTSLCAQVVDFQLNDGDIKAMEPESIPQSDSLQNNVSQETEANTKLDEKTKVFAVNTEQAENTAPEVSPSSGDNQRVDDSNANSEFTQSDEALFGPEISDLIRTESPVKFEPESIDRSIFGAQRKRLKELGYYFDYKTTQTWYKNQP